MYEDWSSNRSVCVGFLKIVVFSLLLSRVELKYMQIRKGFFRNLFCCCSNLKNNDIISQRPGNETKTGLNNDIHFGLK